MGERVFDWLMEHVMSWVMNAGIVLIVLFLLALPFIIYADAKAERFSLKKDEWVCSASVERANTTYIQSGNVMVPVTNYTKHCTQWTEKP